MEVTPAITRLVTSRRWTLARVIVTSKLSRSCLGVGEDPGAGDEPPFSVAGALLSLHGAGVRFGRVRALRDVDLTVRRGERLAGDEAVTLYLDAPLSLLGRLAEDVRARRHPERVVTYIIDRNVNYTNVCNVYCKFCAFYRTEKVADAYVITPDEMDRNLTDYELATSLSYFLWSSMPDDELFDLASQGRLSQSIDAQVRRMLADRRSEALSTRFASQWLRLQDLDKIFPDYLLVQDPDDDGVERAGHRLMGAVLERGIERSAGDAHAPGRAHRGAGEPQGAFARCAAGGV